VEGDMAAWVPSMTLGSRAGARAFLIRQRQIWCELATPNHIHSLGAGPVSMPKLVPPEMGVLLAWGGGTTILAPYIPVWGCGLQIPPLDLSASILP